MQQLEPVSRRGRLAVFLAALTYMVISITLTGTNIAFPAITDDFAQFDRVFFVVAFFAALPSIIINGFYPRR